MIAIIVDDKEIQKRERHLEYRKIHAQTHRGQSVSGLNRMGGGTQRFDPNHWIKLGNSSSRSREFNITDKGELNLAQQLFRLGSQKRSNTLYQLCCGLQRHLRDNGHAGVNVFTDTLFKQIQDCLDAEVKRLTGLGVGLNIKEGQALSEDEENEL